MEPTTQIRTPAVVNVTPPRSIFAFPSAPLLYRWPPAGVFEFAVRTAGVSRAVRVPMLFPGLAPLYSFAPFAAQNN
jgi:hypothetical protein